MALIKCPECGKEISNKAVMCPHCGCPSSEWNDVVFEEIGKNDESVEENSGSVDKGISKEITRGIILDVINKYSNNETEKMVKELHERNEYIMDETKELIDGYTNSIKSIELNPIPDYPYTVCPECGSYNRTGVFVCEKCRHRYTSDEYKVVSPWKEEKESILYSSQQMSNIPIKQPENIEQKPPFHGIYRYGLFGGKTEVYCPRCHSANCSYYQEQKIIPGKTKTRYTANLNPLKPFTLVNKKEKVVKKEKIITESKIMCNDCGHIFF